MSKLFGICGAAVISTVLAGCVSTTESSSSSSLAAVTSSVASSLASSAAPSSSSSLASSVVASSSSVMPIVDFEIGSTSFEPDGTLPALYSCEGKAFGDGVSPALTWTAGPEGTKSYAIAFKDTTVIQGPNPSLGYHWVTWNIPATTLALPEMLSSDQFPAALNGAEQKSAFNAKPYAFFGPCPSYNYCQDGKKNLDSYSFVIYAMGQATVRPSGSVQSIENYLAVNALEATEVRATSDAAPACAVPVPQIDGAKLVADNCSGCHGNLANRSAAQIKSAIQFVGAMSGRANLKALTDAQIEAMAKSLVR